MVNNIRDNTIGEISAKKRFKLNKIKNAGIIKYKKCTPKQKELLNLFNDLLDAILTDKTLKSKSQKDNILMSSKDENERGKEKKNEKENENDKTLKELKINNKRIKELNDDFNEIIDKSKSFEDQIKSIKKVENLNEYWFTNDYGDKELKFKIFKLRLAPLSNIIDKKLFKQIFGHTFETLANKLINTTNKEENQIIVNNINENKEKLYKEYEMSGLYDYVIQPSD